MSRITGTTAQTSYIQDAVGYWVNSPQPKDFDQWEAVAEGIGLQIVVSIDTDGFELWEQLDLTGTVRKTCAMSFAEVRRYLVKELARLGAEYEGCDVIRWL
jgi:hypothetical protein